MNLQTLKDHIQLSEIIGSDVRLKKTGQKYVGLCPFHQEKTPSFWIDNAKGLYHCFGCGASGDVINYLTDKRGLHFKDAVLYLSQKTGIALPKNFFAQTEEIQTSNPLLTVFETATLFF